MISEADRPLLTHALAAVQQVQSTIPPALTANEYGHLDKTHRANWVFVTLPSGAQRYIPKVWGPLQVAASDAAKDLTTVLAIPGGMQAGFTHGLVS